MQYIQLFKPYKPLFGVKNVDGGELYLSTGNYTVWI